jgi:quercetin dioxygenase-like cupin family protein
MLTIVSRSDVPVDTRRGGRVQTLLSPRTVGSTSGFMGIATVEPGNAVAEHYHPYSEEFVYVVSGQLDLYANGELVELSAGQAVLIPIETRHRLVNRGRVDAQIVFHLGPLAPRPELGHVDTEEERLNREHAARADAGSEGAARHWRWMAALGMSMGYATPFMNWSGRSAPGWRAAQRGGAR